MKHKIIKTLVFFLLLMATSTTQGQSAFAVKKWKGRYPSMNNDYPLSFVSWKGWLPPVPHFFVRLYPSHYYYYLNSIPAMDTKGYVDMTLYDALKMVLKTIDKNALQKSMQEVSGIQLNQLQHQEIEAFLRNSRLSTVPDIYQSADNVQQCLQALDYLKSKEVPNTVIENFESALNQELEAYLMIGQMDAEQGDKLKALASLNQNLRQLAGTITYTAQKVAYFQSWNNETSTSLRFLGHQ